VFYRLEVLNTALWLIIGWRSLVYEGLKAESKDISGVCSIVGFQVWNKIIKFLRYVFNTIFLWHRLWHIILPKNWKMLKENPLHSGMSARSFQTTTTWEHVDGSIWTIGNMDNMDEDENEDREISDGNDSSKSGNHFVMWLSHWPTLAWSWLYKYTWEVIQHSISDILNRPSYSTHICTSFYLLKIFFC